MAPHKEPPAQISANLGKFWSHFDFLDKKQEIPLCALRHWHDAKILELQSRNGLNFWIHHGKSRLPVYGQEILTKYGSPKGQKTPKNGLSASFLTHRKQSWENGDLEGQMSTKFKNFSWVRK